VSNRLQCWIATMCFIFGFSVTPTLQAQGYTFSVLHNFTGTQDGAEPLDGVIIDPTGNLYGTTSTGRPSYGAVYELKEHDGGWTLNVLHGFNEGEGYSPAGRPFRAADGTLYGTTQYGGGSCNCGIFYHLTPPATFPRTPLTPWVETILYEFTTPVGVSPSGDLTFDQQSNVYGTTQGGGSSNGGAVYELTHSGNDWTGSNLASFPVQSGTPALPRGGVVFDLSGNLWGTTSEGGQYLYGTVFELISTGSGWAENTIVQFDPSTNGGNAEAGLLLDASGNLYGDTACCGTSGEGTAFEISNSGQNFALLYNFSQGSPNANYGPYRKLTMDSEGNLYGTTYGGGVNERGSVFKLSPSNRGWTYTSLHDFDGSDGYWPESTVTIDSHGNLYGTTTHGGTGDCGGFGCGVVWELTPQT
jgi:uncharacterized repeat protein (TIGR03803 family)